MRKYRTRSAAAIALTTVLIAGTLAGCTLNNPFQTAAPETVQDSAPVPVISQAAVETPAPAESAAELIAPTPTPTSIPTIVPQVLTPTPTPTPAPKILGEESDAETTYKLLIENATGKDIIQLAVRVRSDGYDTAEYFSESEPFAQNDRAMLYYDASYAIKEAKQYGDIPEYQLRFTTEGGDYYVIHNLPFGEIEEIRLMLGNGYAYIVYTKMPENQEISTQKEEAAYAGVEEDSSDNGADGSTADASNETSGGSSGNNENAGYTETDGNTGNDDTGDNSGGGTGDDAGQTGDDNTGDDGNGDTGDNGNGDAGDTGNDDDGGEEYGEDNVIETYEEGEDTEYTETEEDEEGNVVG